MANEMNVQTFISLIVWMVFYSFFFTCLLSVCKHKRELSSVELLVFNELEWIIFLSHYLIEFQYEFFAILIRIIIHIDA